MFFVHVLNNQGENSASIKDSQVKRGNYKQLEPEKKNVIFTIILHSSLFFCKYFSYMWVALPLDGRAVAFWWSLNRVSITTRKQVWRLPSAWLKLRTETHIGFIHPPIRPSIHPTICPTIHSSYKYSLPLKRTLDGTSLALQCLRLCASTSGSMGSPLVQELRSHRSDQIRSVDQSCPTLCNPMNRGTPGLPVHHQLPEFTQTHVLWVGDAIQPSHPLSSPFPPALNLSQHQGLFKWVSSSHQVAKVLEFQLQHQSFQWTPRTGLL